MKTSTTFWKKSDLILGWMALIVVGGLCLKGAYSLFEEKSHKELSVQQITNN